jgi:hypothetical protein
MGWIYGRLKNGQPFKKWVNQGDEKPHILADVTLIKREEPMRKQVAPVTYDEAISYYVAKGIPRDVAASGVHRVECVEKARLKEENPADVARNQKLAWIDGEQKRLQKLGGMSPNAAIDQAQRNWAAQNNSPGWR